MENIALVLSSLALLAATVSVIIAVTERKRSQKRNTAQLQHTDVAVKAVAKDSKQQLCDMEKRLESRLAALEKGVVPDYEKAKEAADAVNSFNAGITGILGYDPYSALQAQRDRENRGEQM